MDTAKGTDGSITTETLFEDLRPELRRLRLEGWCRTVAGIAGLLYALMTLRQLWRRTAGGRWELPGVRIRDYPDVAYRVLDWLMNAECNRWCYDWGDGPRAVAARIKRRLDLCLAYKINTVHFDGLGWDASRTPGYAALMRKLNAYARDRGILLIAGGCGGGYGPTYQVQFQKQGKYWGQAFYNRRRYPAGAVYLCQGNPLYERRPGFPRGLSRSMGTCLSNAALRALKLRELADYVRKTEPGALYIHDLDTGDYRATSAAWKLRCPRCRRRWPNASSVRRTKFARPRSRTSSRSGKTSPSGSRP